MEWDRWFASGPRRRGCNLKFVIFKLMSKLLCCALIFCDFSLRCIPQNLNDDYSALIQIMASQGHNMLITIWCSLCGILLHRFNNCSKLPWVDFCYTYILFLYSIACNVWKHRGGELTNQNIVPQIRSAPVLPKMQRTLNRHHYHHPEVVPNTQNACIEGFLPSTCGAANGIWYWITHNIGRTL